MMMLRRTGRWANSASILTFVILTAWVVLLHTVGTDCSCCRHECCWLQHQRQQQSSSFLGTAIGGARHWSAAKRQKQGQRQLLHVATAMKIKIGILGLPNVGKSSLFNAIAQKSIARAENLYVMYLAYIDACPTNWTRTTAGPLILSCISFHSLPVRFVRSIRTSHVLPYRIVVDI